MLLKLLRKFKLKKIFDKIDLRILGNLVEVFFRSIFKNGSCQAKKYFSQKSNSLIRFLIKSPVFYFR